MILSGLEIKKAINNSLWSSNKFAHELNFGPNSVDVTLSPHFLVTNKNIKGPIELDKMDGKSLFNEHITDEFLLQPNELVLGSVNERFDCSNSLDVESIYLSGLDASKYMFVQHYEGRSTLGRMGIQSHVTAGFGDYGFKGAFTLEIINNSPWPILLKKDMRIGQVYFEVVIGELIKYDGYDQRDCKPQYPRLGANRF